jgi:hypothetical protein
VSLVSTRLQTTGLIQCTQRGQIKIMDRAGLERAACECYDVLRSQTDELVFGRHGEPSEH